MTQVLGWHYLIDYSGCNFSSINNLEAVRKSLMNAAAEAGATIITDHFHHFSPQGISGVIVIAQSHLAIHTWPEKGMASVDLFTCSPNLKTDMLAGLLKQDFKAVDFSLQIIERGAVTTKNI